MLAIVPGHADRRVALVIGNSNYHNAGRLPNPVNDAAAMAALFKNAGFEVVDVHSDIGIAEARRAIGNFADTARDSDIAVVYYAGHGIEVDGTNYLIPVDAMLARDFDVEDETISLDRVLRAIELARRLRLVILDACRNNPFAGSIKRSTDRAGLCESRPDHARHPGGVCREGRLDRRRRQRRAQPIHDGAIAAHRDTGPRHQAGVGAGAGRRDGVHFASPGAVRLRLARRADDLDCRGRRDDDERFGKPSGETERFSGNGSTATE
jgi:hypothetical protein